MDMKKARIYIALILLFALCLSGCGEDDERLTSEAERLLAASDIEGVAVDEIVDGLRLIERHMIHRADWFENCVIHEGRLGFRRILLDGQDSILAIKKDGLNAVVDVWEGDIHDTITYTWYGATKVNGHELELKDHGTVRY